MSSIFAGNLDTQHRAGPALLLGLKQINYSIGKSLNKITAQTAGTVRKTEMIAMAETVGTFAHDGDC